MGFGPFQVENAIEIVAGTFSVSRIPILSAGSINRGTLIAQRIGTMGADKIYKGTFGSGRLATINVEDKTFGTLPIDTRAKGTLIAQRLGTFGSDKVYKGTFGSERLATQDVDDKTFGTLDFSRTKGTLDISTRSLGTLSAQQILSGIAQGDILFIDGTPKIVRLAAGSSGEFLKSQGAAANPVWDTPAGGGAVIATGTYTGNGNQNRAIPHGLGVVPKFVLIHNANVENAVYGIITKAVTKAFGASGTQAANTIIDSTNFYLIDVANCRMNFGSTGTYTWTAVA
ncbi:hypothetical protein KAR91_77870 [Candidatus Pacearchaeota archaeon]|nr:hypothetical protein [Candidatus Pacearchaeota archaeon]